MTFPSSHPINMQQERMVDPFSGKMNVGANLPTLKEFLEITKLSHHAGKFKKLKCAETADLLSAAPRVALKHVEEQRLRRYFDHFYQKRLTAIESMEQPVSLEEFFRISSLPASFKPIKALGVVEYDDLFWISYTDITKIIPKKIEYARFKRYLEKFKNVDPKDIKEPKTIDLKSFLQEASLKNYKSTFEKLGVVEGEDILSITRSDLPKMPQVEFERFLRHRTNKFGHIAEQPIEEVAQNLSTLDLNQSTVPGRVPSITRPTNDFMNRSLSLDSSGQLSSPPQSPVQDFCFDVLKLLEEHTQEQPPAYTPTGEYPNLNRIHENRVSITDSAVPFYPPSNPVAYPVQPNVPYGFNPTPNPPYGQHPQYHQAQAPFNPNFNQTPY